MRSAPFLAAALLALAPPLAAAGPLDDCQQYPIGVEEACYAAGPAANDALALLEQSVGCMLHQNPPVAWPACLPGAPTVEEVLAPLQSCRNPTWDRCIDELLGPIPL